MYILINQNIESFYKKLREKFEHYTGKDLFWGTTTYSLEINKEKKHILIYSRRFFSTTVFLKGKIINMKKNQKLFLYSPTTRLLKSFFIFFFFTGILSIYQADYTYSFQALVFCIVAALKIKTFNTVFKSLCMELTMELTQ